ncbi:MAG: hypothetical protein HOE73_07465 [Bacteroidetes Order II. Incertae sedis bacterium]|nr:hypothetical protein [Bacteroidetes Order II. bacterium]
MMLGWEDTSGSLDCLEGKTASLCTEYRGELVSIKNELNVAGILQRAACFELNWFREE